MKRVEATESVKLGRNGIVCRIRRSRPLRLIFEEEYAA